MPDISRFRRRAIEIARGIETNAALMLEDVSLRVIEVVAETTPVDEGVARSNWLASVGSSADLSPRPVRSVADVVDEARSTLRSLRADATVTIANGGEKVPYIVKLNSGSSTQAPAGFVANAAAAGLATAAEARLLRPRAGRGRRLA